MKQNYNFQSHNTTFPIDPGSIGKVVFLSSSINFCQPKKKELHIPYPSKMPLVKSTLKADALLNLSLSCFP
jgi:hypothetical protein